MVRDKRRGGGGERDRETLSYTNEKRELEREL